MAKKGPRYISNAKNERARGQEKAEIAEQELDAKRSRFMQSGLYKFAAGSSTTDKIHRENELSASARAKTLRSNYKKRWSRLPSERANSLRSSK